jgi:sugar lactone lactonase YvrE
MRGVKLASAALGLTIGVLAAIPASAYTRQEPTTMANLGVRVEGIAVGSDNNVYTAAMNGSSVFIIPGTCPESPCTVTQRPITNLGPSPSLLGMGFTMETTPRLVVADSSSGQVWALTLNTMGTGYNASVVMTIPQGGEMPPNRANSFLNAITFDPGGASGNIYVSDSGNGIIWTATLQPNISVQATQWIGPAGDPEGLLQPPMAGGRLFPLVGANGIAFSNGGTRFFVANTGFRNIIQIAVTRPTMPTVPVAGTPFILVTGINGPDGIAVQKTGPVHTAGRLWVAANQSDEIVVIDTTSTATNPGRVIQKLGDFNGLTTGTPNPGLLFPASVAFSNDGQTLYVTNPAFTQGCPTSACMPQPVVPPPSIDSAWTNVTTAFPVVKFERIRDFTPLPFP